MNSHLSRRALLATVLIGGAGAVVAAGGLVEADVLPGRIELESRLGQGGHPGSIPDVAAGSIRSGTFTSKYRRGVSTGWTLAYPPGIDPDNPRTSSGARLPVCVVLHGRGASAHDLLTLGYPNFLAAAVRAKSVAPFALAAVDGGQEYWHPRRNGDDPGSTVTREFLPQLAAAGLAARDSDRIGLLGWSMGGYGALLIGSQLGPRRVAVIAAESPALWQHWADSAPGAFDGPADFAAHDVFDRERIVERIPLRIDCGEADPFHPAAMRFAGQLHPHPATDFGAGNHTGGYWKAKAAKTIEFVGKALTSEWGGHSGGLVVT